MRKTISVQALKEKINQRIARVTTEDARAALCLLLENVLHETRNYNGYNFVEWLDGGAERWRKDTSTPEGCREETFPLGLGSDVPREYLGPEYLRRYY